MPKLSRSGVMWLVITAVPLTLGGQPKPPPAPKPYHSQRLLVIGNAVFVGQWKPVTTAGGLWQISTRPARPHRLPAGDLLWDTPDWYVHTSLTGGAAFSPAGSARKVAFTGFGQLGLVRRIDSFVTAWGIAAQAMNAPRAAGGALRAEIMDNIGLQLGYIGVAHESGGRLLVSIDYFKKLCDDLGFGWVC